MTHHWPGNVRELEHVIERAAVFATGRTVSAQDIRILGLARAPEEQSLQQAKARVVERFEKAYIQGLLTGGHLPVFPNSIVPPENR